MLMALDAQPIAADVAFHSIIANIRHETTPDKMSDGVVDYQSAHLDGAASERIVTATHSCEDDPEVINEVWRILHIHLAELNRGFNGRLTLCNALRHTQRQGVIATLTPSISRSTAGPMRPVMSNSPLPPPVPAQPPVETDPRFPSGPWQGFFLMAHLPGRHKMELHLNFRQGAMTGEGRDMIGPFLIRGKYNLDDGKCSWSKRYVGKHDVAYQGYNEGKGIWGLWEIPPTWRGGFHIWPTAMGDPTSPQLSRAIDEPTQIRTDLEPETLGAAELEPVGAATDSW
jgi:hypothetical protein